MHSIAIVTEDDLDLVPTLGRVQADCPGARLPSLEPLIRVLNAVIDGVAQHMHQWITELLCDTSIDLRLTALNHQPRFLAGFPRQVTHHPLKWTHDRRERDQPDSHHLVLDG